MVGGKGEKDFLLFFLFSRSGGEGGEKGENLSARMWESGVSYEEK